MGKSLYIITGNSKGLGKALVNKILLDEDAEVVGISRSNEETSERFAHFQLDLRDTPSLINQLPHIFPKGKFEKMVLINNAGWIGEIAPLGKLDPRKIADIHLINVVAPSVLMNAFVQVYGQSDGVKVVVNVSSGAAGKSIDGWSGYCSSKAALNRLTMVAQEESDLKGHGIRYVALSPGTIDTAMQHEIRSVSKENFSQLAKFEALKAEKQLSSPEDTAEKILYLLNNLDDMKGVLLDVREF